jgi:iron complex transport system ATP-binding protein
MTKQLSRRGVAVITVIHDLNLAAMFAERVIAFSAGEIVADGAPAAVVTDAIVGKVFDVTGVVNQTPWTGLPFVIPHNASPNRQ